MEQFPQQKNSDQLKQQIAQGAIFGGSEFMSKNMPDLLKMSEDELKTKYPEQYEDYLSVLRANKEELPATTRGFCVKITDGEKVYIAKALESSFEGGIAQKVADLNIGPKQFNALPGTMREEFIKGTPLLELPEEKCTPEFMKQLGIQTAQNLKKLHENDILVNDQILTNDLGKSHFILDENEKVRFIDFGASIDLKDYPRISDEAVYSLMRTDPMAGFVLYGISQEELPQKIQEYREVVLSQYPKKEDIINVKDTQLLHEGLSFLSRRLPNVNTFAQGIGEILNED